MADAVAQARMARALKERAALAGPVSDEYFLALADTALGECGRVITVTQSAPPAQDWLLLARPDRGDTVQLIGRAGTQVQAVTEGEAFLAREGRGQLYVAQIRAVLTV